MKTKRTQKEAKEKKTLKWHTKEQLCNVTNPHEPPAAVKRDLNGRKSSRIINQCNQQEEYRHILPGPSFY